MSNPQFWWYVTRASAMIAWVVLVISVIWGILLSTRIFRKFDNPAWLLDLHRWLSGIAVSMTALHMFSLYMDSYAPFSIQDLFIPFHSTYTKFPQLGGLPVALGVICAYLLIAVQSTSLIMRLLPRKFWKGIHYTSYVVVLLVSFHAGWTGTDTRAWLYRIVAIALIMLTTVALIVRIIFPKSAKTLSSQVEGRRPNKREETIEELVVTNLASVADEILEIKFSRADATNLKPWQSGSHLTLHLPNELKRQYSICGDPTERNSYTIAVQKSSTSRGGSKWIHENLNVGDRIAVSGPHNNFELEPANNYMFIAGGIGITPIKAMVESLPANRNWKLIYLGKTRTAMPYVTELEKTFGAKVITYPRDEHNKRFDLASYLQDFTGEVYTCGPESLLESLQTLVPKEKLHFERFASIDRSAEYVSIDYQVELKRSGKKFAVKGNQNLLKQITKQGGEIISSCGEGVCGTCEVRVLAGEPMHLDSVMSDFEKDELGVMYPCVSRSRSEKIVLDV